GVVEDRLVFELDGAADAEDDGPRPVGLDGFPQAAVNDRLALFGVLLVDAIVVEGGDLIDLSAASAARESAVAFGAGKGELSGGGVLVRGGVRGRRTARSFALRAVRPMSDQAEDQTQTHQRDWPARRGFHGWADCST